MRWDAVMVEAMRLMPWPLRKDVEVKRQSARGAVLFAVAAGVMHFNGKAHANAWELSSAGATIPGSGQV